MNMWTTRVAAFWMSLALGCTSAAPPAPVESDQPIRPLARINGEEIYPDDLQRFLRIRLEEPDAVAEPTPEIVDDFITHRLLLQEARRTQIQADPAEVRKFAMHWLGAEPDEDLLLDVRDLLLVEKFVQSNISAQDSVKLHGMQQYYEKHANEFVQRDRIRVLEILVSGRRQAEEIRTQLEPGDFRLFRESARLHSAGSTAAKGGELGVFEPGELPQRFEQVIFSLRVGEISEVFESELGYHIFTVEEHTYRHAQKFYEVYNEIFERLVMERERQAFDALVAELLDRASIEILDPALAIRGSEENVQTQR